MGWFDSHTHIWSKWKETDRAEKMRYIHNTPVMVGLVIFQERECGSCGKKQIDKQEVGV